MTESVELDNENDLLEGDITKIYSKELHLSPIQSDDVEWIYNCLTKNEREELLEKAMVICAGFYPRLEECKDLVEYDEKIKAHKGKNTCKMLRKNENEIQILKKQQESHAWISANIGNNITARARSMAWYMEKDLHGTQKITERLKLTAIKDEKFIGAFYYCLRKGMPQRRYKLEDAFKILKQLDNAILIKNGMTSEVDFPVDEWKKIKEEMIEKKMTSSLPVEKINSSVTPLKTNSDPLSDQE